MSDDRMSDALKAFDETDPADADRADDAIRRRFMERILERYAFDVSCFSDPDWDVLDDLLTNPDNPELDESWDEENRIAKAEKAFLVSVGLWGIIEGSESWDRQQWAKDADARFRQDWRAGLSADELEEVIEAGKSWLKHLGSESTNG